VLATALAGSLVPLAMAWRMPGNNQGYEPQQPIAYSHRLHAGQLGLSCFYCHSAAETSRYAGIPSAGVCMNCHVQVRATAAAIAQEDVAAQREKREPSTVESAELRKLYDALALDADLQPVQERPLKPIAWTRVHVLPDFVYFDHRAHITAGVTCQRCHGPIETMDRVRQFETLAMGWCVNCHREVNETGVNGRQVSASIDCVTCHF
jgi:hypothetical protein